MADESKESMTEEQRMEEGRRMFQIFAARMFEQRVLTAYKEKVAKEKAEMLLQEQEEEERRAEERKAKKARDAQKKKAKKDLQKQAKAEEKAKKDAEKAEEEAAAKAAEDKKQEEQRKKKEEQRKKKEAERKAQDEEKQKKEAERLKRQQEERERQQEAERKAREQKAQEKKAKEEARRKQREEQEAKEREARERKAQEDKERKEREAKAKAEREAAAAAAAAAKSVPLQPPTIQKRPSQQPIIGAPPGLRGSPQIAPALPKAPTPAGRPRQTSQPVSHGSSPGNSHAGSAITGGPPGLTSPTHAGPQSATASNQPTVMPKTILTKHNSTAGAGPQGGRTQPNSPIQPPGQDLTYGNPFGQPFPMNPFATPQPPGAPTTTQRAPVGYPQQGPHQPFSQHPSSFQAFPPGGSMRGHPPGMPLPGMPPFGRGHPLDTPPGLGQPMSAFSNQFPPPASATTAPIGPPGHSRTSSASIDKSPLDGTAAFATVPPGTRLGPVKRPASTRPHPDIERHLPPHFDESLDEMAQKMGSASLGGDEDEPFGVSNPEARAGSMALGGPSQAPSFAMSPLVTKPSAHGFGSLNGLPSMSNNWPPQGFPHSNVTTPSWGTSSNASNLWSTGPGNSGPPSSFGGIGPGPAAFQNPRDRLRQLRVNVCRACRQLDNVVSAGGTPSDGFHDLQDILHGLNTGMPPQAHVGPDDVVDILDTLGDAQNGGGNFHVKQEQDSKRIRVKYENDLVPSTHSMGQVGGQLAGLGPIASPVQQPSSLAGRPFAPIGSQGF